jgi:hypothetical protein
MKCKLCRWIVWCLKIHGKTMVAGMLDGLVSWKVLKSKVMVRVHAG